MPNYKEIDLSAWTKKGEGGNGTTYINEQEPGVILKVSHREDGLLEAVSKEFYTSKAIYDLGISTPKMIELVRVQDEYGIKSQLISPGKSLARLCGEKPEMIEKLAICTAKLAKQIHSTSVPDDQTEWIPSMKALMLEALASTQMLSGRKLKEVTAFVESLEDAPTLLHGDFSMGNLIFQLQSTDIQSTKDLKPYWIDLGRAVHGIPMFDLGHMFLYCNIFSRNVRVQRIAHMKTDQMKQFWNSFALAYNGPDNMESFNAECKRFATLDLVLLGHIQTLNWHERLFLRWLAKKLFKTV